MSKPRIRSRNWCFTSFNIKDLTPVWNEYNDIIRYLCYGYETCPTTNKKHIQGWIQFYTQKDIGKVQRILGLGKIHLEKCKGNEYDNDKYCKKSNNFKHHGEFKFQGERTDLENVYKKIVRENQTRENIIMENFETYCRYRKGILDAIEVAEKNNRKQFRKVEVEWVWGDTDHGKTRYGFENTDFLIKGAELKWWDGYNGESSICIDEYDSDIPITRMLNLLDGYPLRLPIKGSFTYANWTKVIVTSNLSPDEIHPNAKECHKKALKRRISKITEMSQSAQG